MAEELKPTIIAINETHLNEEVISIPGYTIYKKDRSSYSGGILIAVKDIIKNIAIEVSRMDGGHEGLWMVLDNSVLKLRIGVIYMPQEGTKKGELKKAYDEIRKEIKNEGNENTVLIGDFNAKIGRSDRLEKKSASGKLLEEFVLQNNLVVINHEPVCRGRWTRVQGETHSEIDYVITTKQIVNCITEVVIDEEKEYSLFHYKEERYGKSCIYPDHNPIITKIKWKAMEKKNRKRVQIMTQEGWKRYARELEEEQLHTQIIRNGDISEEYTKFNDTVISVYEKCTKRVTRTNVGKINRQLLGTIKKLKKRKRKERLSKEELHLINHRIILLQEHCESELVQKRRRQVETAVSKIKKSGKTDLTEFWDLSRKMQDKKAGVRTAIIDMDGKKITDVEEIKRVCKNYYNQLLTTRTADNEEELQAEEIVETAMRAIDLLGSRNEREDLSSFVEEAIKQLKKRKASDMQSWRNELIIYGGETIQKALTYLFEMIYLQTRTPKEWDEVRIKSIPKGASLSVKKRRGLFMTNVCSKLFERVLKIKNENRMRTSPFQCGGVKKRSTTPSQC